MTAHKNIEVEIKSFVSDEAYERLRIFFQEHARFVKEDTQETVYFAGDHDIRIQKNDFFTKIVLKRGKVHDEIREEIEIPFDNQYAEACQKFFAALDLREEIKWYRHRLEYQWEGVNVMLDSTKGYGKILELEIMADPSSQDRALAILKEKLAGLDVALTPREEFESRFADYKIHWRQRV